FDEGGLATPIRCGYLGTVRRKGRKQISQPKEVIASSLLYPDLLLLSCSVAKRSSFLILPGAYVKWESVTFC
ncbi:MAG: hypothetical protein WAW31_14630, partial [Smithella sp.]